MTNKMTDKTEMTKKRQKMTNKMTDKTEMTKKRQTNDKKNDRQN